MEKVVTLLFGILCTPYRTCTKESKKRKLSEEIRNKIIGKHVKGGGYKTIFKQLDVPVTTVARIIKKFMVHGTVDISLGTAKSTPMYWQASEICLICSSNRIVTQNI